MGDARKVSRRGFVGAAAGTTVAAALGPFSPVAAAHRHGHGHDDGDALLPKSRIGIQLYTVRDQVNALGFEEVFKRLSAMGYREVEFAGYNAQGRRWSNEELRGLLRKYRLKAAGSHVGYTGGYSFASTLEQVLDDAEEIGMKYIGTASGPSAGGNGQTVDGYKKAAEDFNRFGAAARERGLRFYQHNHDSEFQVVDGTRLYDVLFEETDPRLVFLEMDIFWAYVGQSRFPGFRPSDYVWDNPERYPLFHVKDGLFNGGRHSGWTMTDVGAGDLPYEPFFCGLDTDDHHFIMENDDAAQAEGGSFGDAERSYDYMASLRERAGGKGGHRHGHHGHKHRGGRGGKHRH
ncbi:MAG TPA: sugar phosphate isomerase/epimerase [Solirubrobacteraceae bacterium]|nr:sugar phosphate isomerase/epimerase [Solirubrobacteraceae bacterium]